MVQRHFNGTVIKQHDRFVLDVGHPENFVHIPDEYQEEAQMHRGWLVTVYINTDDRYEYWKFCEVERRTRSACSRELLQALKSG